MSGSHAAVAAAFVCKNIVAGSHAAVAAAFVCKYRMQQGRNAMGVAGSLLGMIVAMLMYYVWLQPLLLRAGVILSQ